MSSKTKTITYYIEGPDWAHNIELDTEVFDTLPSQLFEAGTRAIEKQMSITDKFNIGAVIIAKKSKKAKLEMLVNSYICLINAAKYGLAEDLRNNFKKETGQDLATDDAGFSEN